MSISADCDKVADQIEFFSQLLCMFSNHSRDHTKQQSFKLYGKVLRNIIIPIYTDFGSSCSIYDGIFELCRANYNVYIEEIDVLCDKKSFEDNVKFVCAICSLFDWDVEHFYEDSRGINFEIYNPNIQFSVNVNIYHTINKRNLNLDIDNITWNDKYGFDVVFQNYAPKLSQNVHELEKLLTEGSTYIHTSKIIDNIHKKQCVFTGKSRIDPIEFFSRISEILEEGFNIQGVITYCNIPIYQRIFKISDNEPRECLICKENIQDIAAVLCTSIIPHYYHSSCILMWQYKNADEIDNENYIKYIRENPRKFKCTICH